MISINQTATRFRLSGKSLVLAALMCGTVAVTSADAAPKKAKVAKAPKRDCEQVVGLVRKKLPVDSTKAVAMVQQLMVENKDCAYDIAVAALTSVPKANGTKDARFTAALIRGILVTVYEQIPELRGEVRSLVMTAITGSTLVAADGKTVIGDGKSIVDGKTVDEPVDARTAAQIAAAVLPVIFAYEPGLVDVIAQSITAEVPSAAGLIAQLRANILSSQFALNRSRLRIEGTVVEPNFHDLTLPELTALESAGSPPPPPPLTPTDSGLSGSDVVINPTSL